MKGLPPGDIRTLVLHWTAGDYETTFDTYHACIALDERGQPYAALTCDPRANMRDVREPGVPYAAHTQGRNSYAFGLSICGMAGATPADFGAYPLREDLVALACRTAAEVCDFYRIDVARASVYTHAEAALEDGYFGCGADERWDVARLAPSAEPLVAADALRAGDDLRARIRAVNVWARRIRVLLWVLLLTAVVVWAVVLWHPWIDWFGRPRSAL